jgi:hypothetical protein
MSRAKSDRWSAEKCGVNHVTVGRLRPTTGEKHQLAQPRTGQDGRTRALPQPKETRSAAPAQQREAQPQIPEDEPEEGLGLCALRLPLIEQRRALDLRRRPARGALSRPRPACRIWRMSKPLRQGGGTTAVLILADQSGQILATTNAEGPNGRQVLIGQARRLGYATPVVLP